MISQENTAIIIPVRLQASRLPNKPLLDIAGKPMIQHVWESAIASDLGRVVVATDSDEIAKCIESLGGDVCMTSENHQTGTDRMHEALQVIDPGKMIHYIINLQGDLPTINSMALEKVLNLLASEENEIGTLVTQFEREEDLKKEQFVKAVCNLSGSETESYAENFVRKQGDYDSKNLFHHIGIYSFKRDALERIKFFKSSNLGNFEDLEQLQWLENNMSIRMLITKNKSIGVDTQDDLIKAENALLSNNIKALICDIDGTLTNGLVWYGNNGEELKSFNVKDGLAIRKLLSKGFKVGFISGRDSAPLRIRAKELGVEFVKFNQSDKKKGCLELLNEMKLGAKDVAYIGDDESDIPCCLLIPFSFAVNDSHQDLKKISRFHLEVKGGEGVVNEFIEKMNFLRTNKKI